jgi:1-deoxy-D-xylulose-5-phosphate reductoisomerase
MHAVNLETLAKVQPTPPGSLEDLLALDAQSRELATRVVTRLSV